MTALLAANGLKAFYGDAQALFGVDFTLSQGELVAIIGSNGAGKSTLLKCLTGLVRAPRDAVHFKGEAIGGLPPGEIVKRGLAMVPEGRRLFPSLSVEENLQIGGLTGRKGPWNLQRLYALFPILAEKRHNPGTALSGGQQQMVALGRALLANPRLLLCDEISLGLAPLIIKGLYEMMPAIKALGIGILLVEQDITCALAVADRFYCLLEGRVNLAGRPAETPREAIVAHYFGV
jgi:branched-chain amino acid transport system ATP-binding protein